MDQRQPTVVFVYGTLKRGFSNHRLLDCPGAKLLAHATTVEQYPLITDDYYIPYTLNIPGKGKNIKGEIYAVDDAVLATLDKLENHPVWYQRENTPVKDVLLVEESASVAATLDVQNPWMYKIPEERVKPDQLLKPFLECYELAEHQNHYVPRGLRSAAE
eukprot:CAMPEP_0181324966 /NCGR_PEP_ID=MMETSP1101-20121128/20657_1 /TAXON_ID=46948 /ORGANISM="Rhodomonas abbreviata, Strain Caron Lab Isolate" /LENGTH=159 /DNA_ID=CAMNT_0023433209 /DNA_START=106 /DNA_END=585 /DNA_ORIENTATION=+